MRDNKKIAINTSILYVNMIVTIVISLYTSRVILKALGVEDFGIYTVVAGFVSMFGVINYAMTVSVQRNISCKLGEGDHEALRKVFNASLLLHIAVALLVVTVAEVFGGWAFRSYLNIAADRIDAAMFVYHFVVASFACNIVSVPFRAILNAHENMLVVAVLEFLNVLFKLGIAIILPRLTGDALILYGGMFFGTTAIIVGLYAVYSWITYTETKPLLVLEKAEYKTLINFAGLSLFGAAANIGRIQGINIILNLFYGTVLNASFGIANQVQMQLERFSQMLMRASTPQIMKSYSAGKIVESETLVLQISKFSFGVQFIMAIPFIFEAEAILTLWLGNYPEYTAAFIRLIIVNNLIRAFGAAIYDYVYASGKIKYYILSTSLLHLLNIPVAYYLLSSGYPPFSVLVGTICLTLTSVIIVQFLIAQVLQFNAKKYSVQVYGRCILYAAIILAPLYAVQPSISSDGLRLILNCIVGPLVALYLFYVVVLAKNEKIYLKRIIEKIWGKLVAPSKT